MTLSREIFDVAIIGAGPAGLSAAEYLISTGARIVILDEQLRPGGQITRQPPKDFVVKNWLKGDLYKDLKALLSRLEDHVDIVWKMSVSVTGITPPVSDQIDDVYQVWYQDDRAVQTVRAHKVLVAAGCYERPLAFPGSTLPGVMGAGAIQTFLKSQQVLVGARFVFAGTHPLQLVVAEQVLDAGGQIEAIAFAQSPLTGVSRLLRSTSLFSHWRVFLTAARSLIRLRGAGVPLLFKHAVKQAGGVDRLEQVTLQPVTATGAPQPERPVRTFIVDRLGMSYGFQVSAELARQAGADAVWSADQGGWLISANSWQESSQPGLFVAGEITGMAGAEASCLEGRIAGLGMARALGLIPTGPADALAARSRRQLSRQNAFAGFLNAFSRLPDDLVAHMMTPDSLVCRCENITCGALRQALTDHPHLREANGVKLMTRTGMGLCQGRLCYSIVAEVIRRERDCSIKDIGPYHAQWPVKPLSISALLPRQK
ncbi:FAD-dependent oxidoreductase [Paremcibacter congregatus]|uniref:FAD-dependent oxidoreductase n=1 Tax=Paremcibacter congregatus TaxID=2043170 RepID=UPI0030EB77C2